MATTVQIEEQAVTVQVNEQDVLVEVQPADVIVVPAEATVEITPEEKAVAVTVDPTTGDVLVTVSPIGNVIVAPVEPVVDVTVAAPVVTVVPEEVDVAVAVEERVVTVETGLCTQVVSGPSFLQTRIAATSIAFAEVVTVNENNFLVPADPEFAGNLWEAIGAANAAYTAGQGAGFYSYQGRATRMLFDVVPAATDNGKIVYLGAIGRASLTPPAVLDGNSIVKLGVLAGADGATQTPEVILVVDHVDPATFTKRFTVALSHRLRVPSSGVQYLSVGEVVTSHVPITLPTDAILDGASIRVDRTDTNNEYELRVLVGGIVQETVTLPTGQTFASASDFTTFVAEGDDVQVLLARTSGSGASAFRSVNVSLIHRGL